ncbi:hypothetical protein KAU19_07880 [Candidatus Parcubacteria bacterium]|nr:hypothetical protein [Candidatus Parcubacteria bacterium]
MSKFKFKFKCKQCGKEKEVNTKQEAKERQYCSRECVNLMFKEKYGKSKHAKASREIKMNKIAGIQTKKGSTEGIQIIDMEVPKRAYKQREILLAIRNMSEKLGNKYPGEKQWIESKNVPSRDYIVKIFGSWRKAVDKAKALPPKQVFTLRRTRIY